MSCITLLDNLENLTTWKTGPTAKSDTKLYFSHFNMDVVICHDSLFFLIKLLNDCLILREREREQERESGGGRAT